MTRRRAQSLTVLSLLALLLAVATLHFLLPRLVDSGAVRDAVQAAVSREIGGSFRVAGVDLYLLPLPSAALHGVEVAVDDKFRGTIKKLSIYPRILPLLTGTLSVSSVDLEQPDFNLALPAHGTPAQGAFSLTDRDASEERIFATLKDLIARHAGFRLSLKNGNLGVTVGHSREVSLTGMSGDVTLTPDSLKAGLSCGADFFDLAMLALEVHPADLKGRLDIAAQGLRPHALPPFAHPAIADSRADITLHIVSKGLREAEGSFKATGGSLSVRGKEENVTFGGGRIKGSFSVGAERSSVTVERLVVESPALSLSGFLRVDREPPSASLRIEASGLDVPPVRSASLALAGVNATVQSVFGIIRGGEVPRITFASEGRSLEDLGATRSISIEGEMRGGVIVIAEPGLELQEVNGKATISQGILHGSNLSARLGNSYGEKGTLKIGIKGDDAPFHLDIMVKADAAQLPLMLRKFLRNDAVRDQISLVTQTKGLAEGRLILGERLDRIDPTVTVHRMEFSASYGRIPYPIAIKSGAFRYERDTVSVAALNGTLGSSSFRKLKGSVNLGEKGDPAILSGDLVLDLGEIHAWLARDTEHTTVRRVRAASGTVLLAGVRVQGPLADPSGWDYSTAATVKDVRVSLAGHSGDFHFGKGSISISPQVIAFTDLSARLSDASLLGSGRIRIRRGEITGGEGIIEGNAGRESLNRLISVLAPSHEISIVTPITFGPSRVAFDRPSTLSFKGEFTALQGPSFSLDMSVEGDSMDVRKLSVKDSFSDVTLSVRYSADAVSARLDGHLARASQDSVISVKGIPFSYNRIDGRFDAVLPLDKPARLSARGTLAAEGISLLLNQKAPLRIESISLEGSGDAIETKTMEVRWGDGSAFLQGTVLARGDSLVIDMDASGDSLRWDDIVSTLPDRELPDRAPVSVTGGLRLRLGELTIGKLALKPFHADLSVSGGEASLTLLKAEVCGLPFQGTGRLRHQSADLQVTIKAADKEVEPVVLCLTDRKISTTGSFNLDASVAARGKWGDLVNELNGSFSLKYREGEVRRNTLLNRTLKLLGQSRALDADVKDLDQSPFKYTRIDARGTVKGDSLHLDEVVVAGPALTILGEGTLSLRDETISGELLVSPTPLGTSTAGIPLIGSLFSVPVVFVPVSMKGTIDDPEVSFLTPSAIATGVITTASKVFMTPLNVIRFLIPESGRR